MGTSIPQKFARDISKLAVLMEIRRNPEGIHPYALNEKIKQIIFYNRSKLLSLIEEMNRAINPTDLSSFSVFTSEIPILRYNRRIQNYISSKGVDEGEYIEKLRTIFKHTYERLSDSMQMWSSISGIYWLLSNLERSELIEVVSEPVINGRRRKMYGLTKRGKHTLEESFITLMEIMSFLFSGRATKNSPHRGRHRKEHGIFHVLHVLLSDVDQNGLKEIVEDSKSGFIFDLLFPRMLLMNYLTVSDTSDFKEMWESHPSTSVHKDILRYILLKRIGEVKKSMTAIEAILKEEQS